MSFCCIIYSNNLCPNLRALLWKELKMESIIKEKWDEILDLLESEFDVSRIVIDTWIRTLSIYAVEDNVVYFYVDEKRGMHGVEYLQKKGYDDFLLASMRHVLGNSDIEIVINEKSSYEESTKSETTDNDYDEKYYNAVKNSNLDESYIFENFIVGESNKHAYATCIAVADYPSQKNFNPLFLYGRSGLGKTHLIQSIAHYILQHDPSKKVLYVTSEMFTNDIINAIHNNTTEEFRSKYREIDILIIDDIQEIIGKEATQQEFFNTFNFLYNAKKQIIISSDRPPKEMKSLDERLRSRLEWGIPIDIHEPDYETRMAILHKKAELQKMNNIPEEVFRYIAENINSNVRDLEGALHKIYFYSLLSHEDVDIEMTKNTLKDLTTDNNKTVTADTILQTVSEHMNVSVNDIKSKKKHANIALSRQMVMYLCRNYTDLSLQAIGKVTGDRNHATVISGVNKIEEKMLTDENLRTNVDAIIKKLNIQK